MKILIALGIIMQLCSWFTFYAAWWVSQQPPRALTADEALRLVQVPGKGDRR